MCMSVCVVSVRACVRACVRVCVCVCVCACACVPGETERDREKEAERESERGKVSLPKEAWESGRNGNTILCVCVCLVDETGIGETGTRWRKSEKSLPLTKRELTKRHSRTGDGMVMMRWGMSTMYDVHSAPSTRLHVLS